MILMSAVFVLAQTPDMFNYQGVARDNSGTVLASQSIGLQLQIHEGSSGGTVVYSETHSVTTNDFGLFNVMLGNGTVGTGTDLGALDWATNSYYVEVGLDPSGGSSYTSMGTSQLISVPYAMHSGTVGDRQWTIDSDTNIYRNDGHISVGATPHSDARIYSYQSGSDHGADKAAIYGYRAGSSGAANGGSDWSEDGVDAGVKGYSLWGNNFSAGVAGYSYLDYDNSAALVGAKYNGNSLAALAYRDGDGTEWAGYFDGNSMFNGDLEIDASSGHFRFGYPGADGWEFNTIGAGEDLQLWNVVGGSTDAVKLYLDGSSGKIGVNTNSPSYGLHVKQTGSGDQGIAIEESSSTDIWGLFHASTDNLWFEYNGSLSSWIQPDGTYNTSDRTLKNSIQPLEDVLDRVMQLEPSTYFYNSMKDRPEKTIGFIAQEVKEVFPEAVQHETEADLYGIKYDDFGVIAIKAIQEQQEIVEQQEQQIQALMKRVEALESK